MLCFNKAWFLWKAVVVFGLFFLLSNSVNSYAATDSAHSCVKIVKNEKSMLQDMIRRMQKHEMKFSYYYPGISKRFRKYRKESTPYASFFSKLAKKDAYSTAIIADYCIVIYDNPQRVSIQIGYLTTKKQETIMNQKVKRIVRKIRTGTKVQRARKAYDYLINHVKYDNRYYSPYDALMKGKGMCMSYALAYLKMMQILEVPCIYVTGKQHAWNMVKIGKYWYHVDVTFGDRANGRYRYFLKADKDFHYRGKIVSGWDSSYKKAKKSY